MLCSSSAKTFLSHITPSNVFPLKSPDGCSVLNHDANIKGRISHIAIFPHWTCSAYNMVGKHVRWVKEVCVIVQLWRFEQNACG